MGARGIVAKATLDIDDENGSFHGSGIGGFLTGAIVPDPA